MGALLTKAIQKRGDIKVEVCAILNDTTGWMLIVVLFFKF